MSKSQWKRIKHNGSFRYNGARVNAKHTIVHTGDVLTFESERQKPPGAFPMIPESIPLDIRYEDDWLLAVNKPAGMLVHPLHHTPHGTLANGVLGYYQEKGLTHHFHSLHRLDRDTTGLVLIAKEPELQHMLTKNGIQKLFHRTYLAIACGKLPAREGWIDRPIGGVPWSIVEQRILPESEGGKPARTHYEVLGEAEADGQPLSYVRLWLETARSSATTSTARRARSSAARRSTPPSSRSAIPSRNRTSASPRRRPRISSKSLPNSLKKSSDPIHEKPFLWYNKQSS